MEEQHVAKDMADDFNSKLAVILEEIDILKKDMITDKGAIKYLDERIEAWFTKIRAKLEIKSMQEEINKQNEFRKRLDKLPEPCELSGVDQRNGRNCRPYWIFNMDSWDQYKHILNERESHLNLCMEKLGLTNIEKRDEFQY